MKKILITGANSYIGTSFEKYLSQWPDQYQIDTVDMIDGSWREKSFAGYDAVFHVAGIAHIKETAENAHLYYEVNRDLAVETAKKAKSEQVPHFVFLSTMAVYGLDEGAIDSTTPLCPKSNYGKAKAEAETLLEKLVSPDFLISLVRPPMVYGNNCKGNYQTLVKLAKIAPFLPNYKNKRSMIHIDTLSQYIKQLIDEKDGGIHLPQDEEYVCTCEMIQRIAKEMGRDLKLFNVLNPFVSLIKNCTTAGKKAFGNLYYKK